MGDASDDMLDRMLNFEERIRRHHMMHRPAKYRKHYPVIDNSTGVTNMNMLTTKVIGVKFTNGNADAASFEKQYHYFTDDLTIKKDDYCVVIGAHGAPCIVRVYDDNCLYIKKATTPIVCKINLDEYREKLKASVARAAALKRLKEIDAELSAADRYKHLAGKSDEAKQLLELLGMMSPTTAIEGQAEYDGDLTNKL